MIFNFNNILKKVLNQIIFQSFNKLLIIKIIYSKKIIQYIRDKNFIQRGSRCHGIPMENTKLLFIRELRSWPEIKMRIHLEKTLNELCNKVLSVKRIVNFNDTFFKIKIVGNEEEITSITDCVLLKVSNVLQLMLLIVAKGIINTVFLLSKGNILPYQKK